MEFEFVEFDPTDSPRLSETDCNTIKVVFIVI